MLCPLCHTPIGADDGAYDTGKFLAGGMRVTAYPWGVWYSRNLTADDETGLGRWSEDGIVRALRRGFYTNRTLAGGVEARWRVYGKAVASNLTPHDTDGIGRTNDAELIRALRSGLGRDGRLMHWQAMPWDISSNWSLEDQHAIIADLRALPPVAGKIPAPRPPLPDDPPADSFSFGDAGKR
jgi:hypothetical protein